MSIEQNKYIASQFFLRVSANDIKGALDLVADNPEWWMAGKPGAIPTAGMYSKEKLGRILQGVADLTKDGIRMNFRSMIGEGDKVALELESHAELKSGRVYDQEYHTLMVIQNGKISAAREYYDTQHSYAVWFQP